MRAQSMSNNIVNIMHLLSKNEGLLRLIVNNSNEPMVTPVNLKTKDLINPKSPDAKILPLPFDLDAKINEGTFLRVYYNDGELDDEVLSNSQIHIDIICAKSLWLINDGGKSLIRPYEIMSRVIDVLGKRSANSTIRLQINGYQHLYINSKFDSIRIYCEYSDIETW